MLSGHQKLRDVQLAAPQAPMDLRLGCRAVLLDADNRVVITDDDEVYGYVLQSRFHVESSSVLDE